MSAERNGATVRRLVDEVFNQGALDAIDAIFAPEVIFHRLGDGRPVPDARRRVRLYVSAYRSAFPDLRMQVDELLATEQAVTVCWTASGTHAGPLSHPEVGVFGVPPTGRTARWSGISVYHLVDGRITQSRSYADGAALLRHLGLQVQILAAAPPAEGRA
jgi:steroid delta-isomerase-like uncharacterized protein